MKLQMDMTTEVQKSRSNSTLTEVRDTILCILLGCPSHVYSLMDQCRLKCAAETAGQKERRLKQRRERMDMRARRAAQSVEQRQVRLHKSATERKRQEAETPDHREARLEEWRAAQHELEIGSCDC